MKVSFNETTTQEPSNALVPRAEQAVALSEGADIDRSDLVTPTLNVVAKVGDLSNIFSPGSIVLDKTIELVKKDRPLDVIAVSITKSYQEDTEFGEEFGKRARTLAEVQANGGQVDDRDGENYYVSVARIIFLVKKTAEVAVEADPFFFQTIGDDQYLLAQYYARNSAYSSVAKPLFTLKTMQGSPSKLAYQLRSSLHTFNGNSWFRPNLRPNGKPSDAVAEFIAKINI